MRVLMLSWEYPPLVVGGLGRHVEALARQLVAAGHEVCVVTRGDRAKASDERQDGVRVVRAAADPIAIDFTTETLLAWSQAAEHALLRAALPVLRDERVALVHAHDWLVAQSAVTLSDLAAVPLVTTLHATEAGRHQGWLPQPLNRAIHSVERFLVTRSNEVITCSPTMRADALRLFELDPSRVSVVPNGLEPGRWRRPSAARRAAVRAAHPGTPLLVFAGRLVHEKGVQTLLAALRELRRDRPEARLVVAGTGPYEPRLRAQARELRVARAIDWAGFVPETRLPALLGAADAVVVPSLYEPFGLVALEAAGVGTPVIVSDTGGLADLAAAGVAAAVFPADDVAALTAAIRGVLADPACSARSARRAGQLVRREYTWPAVASRTAAIYARMR